MSPWTNESRRLRPPGFMAALTARWRGAQVCVLKPGDDFDAWCAAHSGDSCRLLLSTQYLHELSFEPGLPLHDEAQRLAYARHQFVHYFGAQAPRWRLAAWTGGASALHALEWSQIQDTVRRHKVRLVGVEPMWAPVLRYLAQAEPEVMRAPKGALAWVEGAQLTWLTLEHGSLKAVRKLRLRAATAQALGDALAELGADGSIAVFVAGFGLDDAGLNLPGATVSGTLNAAAPEPALLDAGAFSRTGLPDIDFLGARVRRPWLAWPLLATSLLVVLTAGWSAERAREAMLGSQARQASLEQRIRARTAAAAPTVASRPAAASSGASTDADVDRRSSDVQAALAWSWEPLLADVEALGSVGKLDWLGLDAAATSRDIHLDGLASNRQDALRAVDQLGAMPGWHQVVLGSLQQADGGQPGQRFDIRARLQSAELRLPASPRAAGAPLKEGA